MNIDILELRILHGDKSLKAFVDIKLGDITLRDFRIMQENGKTFIMAPITTYKDRTGHLRFRQTIDLPTKLRGEIDAAILHKFYGRMREQSDETTKQ